MILSLRKIICHKSRLSDTEYRRAFDDWQQGRWARGITFDEFCEYMLPL